MVVAAACAIAAGALVPNAGAGPTASESIIGGGKANPRGFGFAVALKQKPFGFFCTGSLIAPNKVLTAGHCVKKTKLKGLRVLAGRAWDSGPRAGESIPVKRIRIHPDYKPRLDRRDLAVLTLKRNADAPTIALPTAAQGKRATKALKTVRSAGWGARNAYGVRVADRLKATKEIVYPNRICRLWYGKGGFSPQSMLCALGRVIKRWHSRYPWRTTSCSGDSGGPLVAQTPEGAVLVGVVSAGPLPCGIDGPSIYARTSTSLDFLRRAAGLAPP